MRSRTASALALAVAGLLGQGAGAAAAAPREVEPAGAPAWRILVLVYPTTTVVRDGHTYVGVMDTGERERSIDAATRFVKQDVTRLTSGRMTPELALRVVGRPLNLSPDGDGGWHPDPADASPERDPSFDSVIVVWDQSTFDTALRPTTLHRYAGLTWPMGLGQTYSAIPAEYAGHADTNVFKHEWGHAVLFFHDALGIAPKPAVDNHGPEKRYVHCPDGTGYVWENEPDGEPIPHSIYNNDSGFTHDYLSGTVALAESPASCIGITPEAWAAGGPLSVTARARQASTRQKNSRMPAAAAASTSTPPAIASETTAQIWAMRTSSAPPSAPPDAAISRRTPGASTRARTARAAPRPQKRRPGSDPMPSAATRFAAGQGGGPATEAESGGWRGTGQEPI